MEEVLIVLCVVMPSLKFVVFLLLEKRKTTDRDQLNLERYLFSKQTITRCSRSLGAYIKSNECDCQHTIA
ncbi:hypothetical protein FP738_10515 [Vibrio parahaemolyticus]|nr:hypothetical protein [Vibrio parahaemolyticus]EGQ9786774.1 hypothetical protein [Vibrio parahaemolyticus]EGQ9924856.1 hypothetical protein [Vibrio parahaemolyticus]EGR0118869.1 hypothetical protein [Vibrio parahaemolyticus]EGR0221079.1 hypothetical protein [Vibrio parahaemolyticus]